jgi:hypothetical protein
LTNPLAHPILGAVLRVGLGAYIVYAARWFYADPLGYFRRTLRGFEEPAWLSPVVRGLAAFCVWGGCFILATVIAVGIFHLHGELTAVALVDGGGGDGMAAAAESAGSRKQSRRSERKAIETSTGKQRRFQAKTLRTEADGTNDLAGSYLPVTVDSCISAASKEYSSVIGCVPREVGSMHVFSAADAIAPAISRTNRFLFQPFRLGTFLKLSLVAVITEGMSLHLNNSHAHAWEMGKMPPWNFPGAWLGLALVAIAIMIPIAFLIAYLITRLRFAYFHCLVYQVKQIAPGWRLYREQAMRFFLLNIGVGIAFLVVLVLCALPFVSGFIKFFHDMHQGGHFDIFGFLSLFLPLILLCWCCVCWDG